MAFLISATAEVIMLCREAILFFRSAKSAACCVALVACVGGEAALGWLVAVDATVVTVGAVEPSESYSISAACRFHGGRLLAVTCVIGVDVVEKLFFRILA